MPPVRGVDCRAHVTQYRDNPYRLETTECCQFFSYSFPFEQLHNEKCAGAFDAIVVNGHDIRMRKRRRSLRFALKSLRRIVTAEKFIANHFYCDAAVQCGIDPLVHGSHSATAAAAL